MNIQTPEWTQVNLEVWVPEYKKEGKTSLINLTVAFKESNPVIWIRL